MNVDVGISGEKSNGPRQGEIKQGRIMSEKYRKLLITFLHCHSKLLDNSLARQTPPTTGREGLVKCP